MKILVDAVLFQFARTGSGTHALGTGVLRELVELSDARRIGLTVLDRGGLPPLGPVRTIGFPSYHAADAVADAMMLQRMAESVGADVLVSTALTMPLLLATVQLICGEDEAALMAGRRTPAEARECEIAVACSSAQVCASAAAEHAFVSRFPRAQPSRPRHPARGAPHSSSGSRRTAEIVLDSVEKASPPFADAGLARRYLALRHMQAGFELSDGRG